MKKFPFLATGTTAYRYKQCFYQDLMIALNNMKDTSDDHADMTVGDKLAYIMNAQAELDQMEEGLVMDMIIESGNDLCEDEYCQVADQKMFDAF